MFSVCTKPSLLKSLSQPFCTFRTWTGCKAVYLRVHKGSFAPREHYALEDLRKLSLQEILTGSSFYFCTIIHTGFPTVYVLQFNIVLKYRNWNIFLYFGSEKHCLYDIKSNKQLLWRIKKIKKYKNFNTPFPGYVICENFWKYALIKVICGSIIFYYKILDLRKNSKNDSDLNGFLLIKYISNMYRWLKCSNLVKAKII